MNEQDRPPFDGIIRPLEEPDLPELQTILEMWLTNMMTGKVIPAEIEEDMGLLKASLEGSSRRYQVAVTPDLEVIGMMGLSTPKAVLLPFTQTAQPIELVNAYVHKDHRAGRGVGRALITTLQDLARTDGFTEMVLDSGPRYRHSGHGFYDKMSYSRVGQIDDYYGKGFPAKVWRKEL